MRPKNRLATLFNLAFRPQCQKIEDEGTLVKWWAFALLTDCQGLWSLAKRWKCGTLLFLRHLITIMHQGPWKVGVYWFQACLKCYVQDIEAMRPGAVLRSFPIRHLSAWPLAWESKEESGVEDEMREKEVRSGKTDKWHCKPTLPVIRNSTTGILRLFTNSIERISFTCKVLDIKSHYLRNRKETNCNVRI